MALSEQKCTPCDGNTPPLTDEQEQNYISELPGWELDREGVHTLRRTFHFDDFAGAMRFVNAVADLAESEQHHPDLFISYDTVAITLWTHKIDGLSDNDFIMAAKINDL
jgi:4a-hydroxytetrahydrobiopterin dehydratase